MNEHESAQREKKISNTTASSTRMRTGCLHTNKVPNMRSELAGLKEDVGSGCGIVAAPVVQEGCYKKAR